MKFRMFELAGGAARGAKVAVNVDEVAFVMEVADGGTAIALKSQVGAMMGDLEHVAKYPLHVADDFHTVISRLNTVAE